MVETLNILTGLPEGEWKITLADGEPGYVVLIDQTGKHASLVVRMGEARCALGQTLRLSRRLTNALEKCDSGARLTTASGALRQRRNPMADMAPMTVFRKKATPGFEAGGRPKVSKPPATIAQRGASPRPKAPPTPASRTTAGKALTSAIASMVMGGVTKGN